MGDLPYLPLSTWTSRWAEQGSSPCRQVLLCPLLLPPWDWKEPELLPPSGLEHGNPPPAHVGHTEAWLTWHRLKCHQTLIYSPLSNTWLLIQSPLVWSTGFNFGRVDSGLATWDLHPEKANTLVSSSDTSPWHRAGLAQTKFCQSWLHGQQNQSLTGHFISDSTFLILLLYYVCKGLKFSNPLSALTSLPSRFLECNFKLKFMKESHIYGTPGPKAMTLFNQALRSKWDFKKDEALHSTQSFRTELVFLFFFLSFSIFTGRGVRVRREKDNPAAKEGN